MKTLCIGRIRGIPICVHPAFPLLLLSSSLMGELGQIVSYLLALCCHEGAHALTAYWMGLKVERVELMPFGGVAHIDMMDVPPWQEALVALAGPLVNLLFVAGAVFGAEMAWWHGQQIQTFVRCNLILMLVNLLPGLPLDGGRILRALSAAWLGIARSTRVFSLIGMILASSLFGLGVAGLFWKKLNPTWFVSGAYLFYAAAAAREGIAAQFVHRLSDRANQLYRIGSLPIRWMAVRADLPIARIPAQFSPRHYHVLVPMNNDLSPRGLITEERLLDALIHDQGQPLSALIREGEEHISFCKKNMP